MPNCPICNAPVKEGAKSCSMCGSRLETKVKSIFCPVCGNALKEGAKSCNVCGAEIKEKKEEKPVKEEPKVMQSTGEADLSVLNSMEQMNNPKPSSDGSSGDMDSAGIADLKAYDAMQEKIKEEEEKQKENMPTMDAVESPKINIDDLGTADDEDTSQYPTMDSVEMPGQSEKKKPEPKPQPKPQSVIPIPTSMDMEFSKPEVVKPIEQPQNKNSVAVKKSDPVKLVKFLLPIIILAVISVGVILINNVMKYRNYEDAIKDYKKVCEGNDTDGAFQRLVPGSKELEPFINDMISFMDSGIKTPEDFYMYASSDLLKQMINTYGNNFKVDYEIIEKEKMTKDEVNQEQEDFNKVTSTINDLMNTDAAKKLRKNEDKKYDIKKTEFKCGMKLKVKFKYKGDKNTKDITEDVHIVKYNDHWSITKGLDMSFGFIDNNYMKYSKEN